MQSLSYAIESLGDYEEIGSFNDEWKNMPFSNDKFMYSALLNLTFQNLWWQHYICIHHFKNLAKSKQ